MINELRHLVRAFGAPRPNRGCHIMDRGNIRFGMNDFRQAQGKFRGINVINTSGFCAMI